MPVNEPSRKVKVVVFAIGGGLLLAALASAVALEFGGLPLLHWVTAHPAARAKYDPHHWLSRLLALCILLSIGHTAFAAMRNPAAKTLAWQRVFLPWRKKKPMAAEQPMSKTAE